MQSLALGIPLLTVKGNYFKPTSPLYHFTPHNALFLSREGRFPIFLIQNEMAEEKKVPFGMPREEIHDGYVWGEPNPH